MSPVREKDNVFSLYGSPAKKGRVYLIRAEGTDHFKIGTRALTRGVG